MKIEELEREMYNNFRQVNNELGVIAKAQEYFNDISKNYANIEKKVALLENLEDFITETINKKVQKLMEESIKTTMGSIQSKIMKEVKKELENKCKDYDKVCTKAMKVTSTLMDKESERSTIHVKSMNTIEYSLQNLVSLLIRKGVITEKEREMKVAKRPRLHTKIVG